MRRTKINPTLQGERGASNGARPVAAGDGNTGPDVYNEERASVTELKLYGSDREGFEVQGCRVWIVK